MCSVLYVSKFEIIVSSCPKTEATRTARPSQALPLVAGTPPHCLKLKWNMTLMRLRVAEWSYSIQIHVQTRHFSYL